jgi:carnitine O-acetyltransferase
VFKDDPNPSCNSQITRATSLVRSTLAFAQAIREDRLASDEMRGTPMCMNQYWWLFGVARVPGDDGGRIRLDPDARHIVVLCRGQIYRLYVLEESSNRIIDDHDLSMSLQYIVNDANSIPIQDAFKTSVGLLTTENQKVWSRCRTVLVHEGLKNGQNFSIIDSSLFVLCLDDNSPQNMSDVCKNMICGTNTVENGVQVGTCVNRWYDKLAVIVCRNGAAGMNFEHTCTDGSVDIRMACDIYKDSTSQSEHTTSSNNAPSSNSAVTLQHDPSNAGAIQARVQKLDWEIPSKIYDALRLAEARLVDRIQRHQLETLDIRNYGKALIKSTGFSPDAFFQMALHAAYYSVYKRVRSGFEPVLMRQYLHGRTDVVRTTTPEAAAFARKFSDEKASTAEKVEALHRAADAHVAISKDCAKGLSHHRHLYVLHQMWKRRRAFLEVAGLELVGVHGDIDCKQKQLPTTTIFTDPGWARLGTTILMGSNVDNPCLAYAGFGPAADDGFTVCYFIRQDHMTMTVCCRNGQAKRFIDAIDQTFQDIKTMLQTI